MMLLIDYETFEAREFSCSLITTSVCLWKRSVRGTLTYSASVFGCTESCGKHKNLKLVGKEEILRYYATKFLSRYSLMYVRSLSYLGGYYVEGCNLCISLPSYPLMDNVSGNKP